MRVFLFLLVFGATINAPSGAEAQSKYQKPSYFESLENFARIEQTGDFAIMIGAKNGKNYFRILNKTIGIIGVRVTITSPALSGGSDRKRTVKNVSIAPAGMTDEFFLEGFAPKVSWVTGWELLSIDRKSARKVADRDALPFFRAPPKYPVACMAAAEPKEAIGVNYSVTDTGQVDNIRIRSVTNGCLAEAAQRAARLWIFSPAIADGVAVAQHNRDTQVTFNLSE